MVSRKHSSKKNNNQTGPKRSPNEILRDRALVAKLNLEGLTLEKIAKEIGKVRPYVLSLQTIHNDLKAVKADWISSAIEDYDKTKQIELARIEEDEKRILEEIALYRTPRMVIIRQQGDESGFEKVTQEEPGTGDALRPFTNPSLFTALDRCRERRCKILGFNAAQKSEDINAAINTLLGAGYEVRIPEVGNEQ